VIGRRALLAASLLIFVAGCGGAIPEPCGGADSGIGNPAYAGTYTATYENQTAVGPSGAAKDLTLQLTISQSSVIKGTVTEPSTGRTATIMHGSAGDWQSACSRDHTYMSVMFAFDGEPARTIRADRDLGQTQPWPFTASYEQGSPIGQGMLTLTRQ
jgi:hypothetical protein